ncbi:MAG: hypothetical protein WC683_12610 [bacterium]
MAQTTASYSGIATTVTLELNDISGSSNQVSSTEQRRGSGEGYTFDGDVAIIKAGKREPVEVTFRIIYTEEALEGWELAKAAFEAAGGTAVDISWILEAGATTWTITDGIITRLQYPQADPTDANPVMVEFSVRAPEITTAA